MNRAGRTVRALSENRSSSNSPATHSEEQGGLEQTIRAQIRILSGQDLRHPAKTPLNLPILNNPSSLQFGRDEIADHSRPHDPEGREACAPCPP